jgi:hypothetical protein
MNRAWIPAGALAGMSVAGLLALGPLTDIGDPVKFPPAVHTAGDAAVSKPPKEFVPVSISLKRPVGTVNTETAAYDPGHGGQALVTAGASNSTDGKVAVKVTPGTTVTHQTSSPTPSTTTAHTAAPPAEKPKPKVARPLTIGGLSESNSDQGLASKGDKTTRGEQDSTLAP